MDKIKLGKMKKNEQQLILIDENDNFLGKYAPKSKCHFGKGLHHRAFTLLIHDSKGKVLLQDRKHKLWDYYWDLTNSHPIYHQSKKTTDLSVDELLSLRGNFCRAGQLHSFDVKLDEKIPRALPVELHKEDGTDESYEESVSRCLRREWGIDFPVKKLFSFNYYARFGDFCENEYCAFMVGQYNGEVYPNSEVAYGYKWMPLSELLEDVKIHREIYTPWLLKALEEMQKRKFKL